MGMQALAPAIQAQREKGADSTANWEEAHSHLRCLFHTEQLKRLIIGNTDEGLAHWIEDVVWFLQSSDSHKVKKFASKLHVHSVNFAAKLVHTRRALSSTVVNSHQEPVSGQACNPPDPYWFSFPFRGGGALQYSVPKWLLFLNKCGEWFSLPA